VLQQVMAALGQQTGQQAKRLLRQAKEVLPLVERVIAQTRTRVLEGKKMASGQKVLSLFEPHTRAIARHKGGPSSSLVAMSYWMKSTGAS